MDRKGWIILTICAVLLALNFYYMPEKKPPFPKETEETTEKTPDKPDSDTDGSSDPSTKPGTSGGLEVEPPVETVGENTATLVSYRDGKKLVTYTFTSRGGGIKTALLHDQFAVGSKSENVMLNADAPAPIGALGEGPDNYLALNYDQVVSEEENAVYYTAKTSDGLIIKKKWALSEDKDNPGAPWLLTLDISFRNKGKSIVNLQKFTFFNGAATPLHHREWPDQGGAFYLNDGEFENASTSSDSKVDKGFFHSAQTLLKEGVEDLEYAGVSNQFFTTLVRPSEKYASSFWAKSKEVYLPGSDPGKPNYAVRSGFDLPARKIVEDDFEVLSYTVYVGPKRYSTLKKMEGNVDEVLNYGWFTIVSVVLNNVLNWLHDVAFSKTADKWSWGLSIIALTIIIRIVIWPLHNKSTRTMKRMSKLQPMMKDLREKYKDNPQKLNQETMKLYKEYQINPMGGCLPMFLQIPIFFGYYRMLQYAVELRGEGFLWVPDLSMPDTIYELPFGIPFLWDTTPINLLPILMAVTMVLQMKMTPNTGDKMQRRIMMFMPLIFFFFCYNFASALALYWTTQNIFSIGQTWLMNRMPEPELKKRPKSGKPGKKSFMERMAERAEAMQQAQEAARRGGGKGAGNMRNATPAKKSGKKRPPRTGG